LADEDRRLATLEALDLRDGVDDPVYGAIAKLAAAICDVPIALVGLIDANEQWFLFRLGLDAQPTPREQTFCAHALGSPEVMEVPDARLDARFQESPFVLGEPHIRFYAGVPLAMPDTPSAIGTLCVIDREPRRLTDSQRAGLAQLGVVVTELFEQRRQAREARTALADSEALIRTISDNTPAAICYIGRDKVYRYNNAAYERWLLKPLSEITGRTVREVHGEDVFAAAEPYLDRALAGEQVSFETAFVRAGERRFLRGEYVPDVGPDGIVRGVYGLAQDITALKIAEDQLRYMAQYDALTGLSNRYRLFSLLGVSAARARRHGTLRALLYLDVDRFKAINDAHGHAVGDLVLCEFARRLRACVRDTDTVARLAGDEFVILLEDLHDLRAARQVAEKLLEAMREPFELGQEALQVSTSIGIAVAQPGDNEGNAFREAD
jgi:diguanylate cyclase (GGDEF)-like protein/PAS domain S-box-containing protein